MDKAKKIAITDDILMRAADQLGDITPLAMSLYYRQHPEAEACFDKHCLGQRPQLEGQMIENSLHCLMHWFDSPGEIEILLNDSVSHHNDTLQIPPSLYSGLIEATADVITQTIPAENDTEIAVWNEVRKDLKTVIETHNAQVCAHQKHH